LEEVIEPISGPQGQRPCYELLDSLAALDEGRLPTTLAVTLGSDKSIPRRLGGRRFELVE
jgi:hypothetical protein